MSDAVSRDELQAELRALRADSDAKFERIIGEVRVANASVTGAISTLRTELTGDMNTFKAEISGKLEVATARTAGKWTVWAAAGAVIAAMVGTILVFGQVAQTGYDTGRASVTPAPVERGLK